MKWEDLKEKEEAPEKGWMLAYLREGVQFQQYGSLEEVREKIRAGELLELHLFDKEKEYRCIASQSRRYEEKGFIVERVVPDLDEKSRETYEEDIYLEDLGKKIHVLNYLKYDGNGMLEVDNYRLVMEGESICRIL